MLQIHFNPFVLCMEVPMGMGYIYPSQVFLINFDKHVFMSLCMFVNKVYHNIYEIQSYVKAFKTVLNKMLSKWNKF